jgi:hypothetical protein
LPGFCAVTAGPDTIGSCTRGTIGTLWRDGRGEIDEIGRAAAVAAALFEREVRERLSRSALDLLFARAEVISEGQRSVRGGRDAYFGSTMLTLDLPAVAVLLRDACDAGTARRLATLMETDAGVGRRVEELAAREAARVAGAVPRAVSTHVTIRAQGAKVFIDVDVEATFSS